MTEHACTSKNNIILENRCNHGGEKSYIEKYKTHPDCKRLYCFVYDPEGLLGNPAGIKNDLESAHKDFLKVFIKPE